MKTPFGSHFPSRLTTRDRAKPARPLRAIDRFQLLVDCSDERDQRKLYEQLTAAGRRCRVITI